MTNPKVSFIRCSTYDAEKVEEAVRRAVDLLGGISAFVGRGESVLVKPNLLTIAAPETGIVTHPAVVRAVIRLLKPVASHIFCGDAPSVWGERREAERVYEACGLKAVCEEEGAELVYFTAPYIAEGYPLTDWVKKCDRLISIPKFKTHDLTLLTAGVKNLYGLIVGMSKMKIHKNNVRPAEFSKVLLDIYQIRKPDLTILDGVVALEGDGPGSGGCIKNMDLIAATTDAVALDMILSILMNIAPEAVPTNKEAVRRGLIDKDVRSIEILGASLETFRTKNFKLPKTTFIHRMPKWMADLVRFLFRMKPQILRQACRDCGLCRKICPVGAIEEKRQKAVIDHKKCISCFCCREICPHQAIVIKRNICWRSLPLLKKIIKSIITRRGHEKKNFC